MSYYDICSSSYDRKSGIYLEEVCLSNDYSEDEPYFNPDLVLLYSSSPVSSSRKRRRSSLSMKQKEFRKKRGFSVRDLNQLTIDDALVSLAKQKLSP